MRVALLCIGGPPDRIPTPHPTLHANRTLGFRLQVYMRTAPEPGPPHYLRSGGPLTPGRATLMGAPTRGQP